MAARICFWLGMIWLLGLVITAYPCLSEPTPNLARDLWLASAIAIFPLLRKLFRLAVAAPTPPRKMLSVLWDMIRRMGLTLGMACLVFFALNTGITDRFWYGLAAFYQAALAIETGLVLHEWNTAAAAETGSPG